MNSLIPQLPDQLTGENGLLKTHQLLVVEIVGNARAEITELITRFALYSSFFLVVGGEWVPDQDSLRRSIRRHTAAVKESLGNVILARPSTCLQLRDQLAQAYSQNHPILILDFLHHFYDPDVDLSLRQRVLNECCQQVQSLSQSKPILILVKHLPVNEYQAFFPILGSFADEILKVNVENFQTPALQFSLF